MSAAGFHNIMATRERLTFAVEHGPEHLRPLYLAARDFGVRLATIEQRAGAFRPPTDKPVLMVLGDDTLTPLGPAGFDRKSVKRFAARCDVAVVMSCAPLLAGYAAAAACAAGYRRDALIVESQPKHEQAWLDLLREANPSMRIIVGAVRPASEARH